MADIRFIGGGRVFSEGAVDIQRCLIGLPRLGHAIFIAMQVPQVVEGFCDIRQINIRVLVGLPAIEL